MDDIFRRFLGIGPGVRPRSWPNDSTENSSEDDQNHDFIDRGGSDGPHGASLDDMFDHFHRDMFQQIESIHRQMEDMWKGFGTVDFPSDFHPPSVESSDPKNEGSNNKIFFWSSPSPFFRHGHDHSKKSPRDFMLKEEEAEGIISKTDEGKHKDGPALHTPRWDNFGPGKMEDTDLDGKISDENVLALIKRPEEKGRTDVKIHSPQSRPGNFFSSHSISISSFSGPDGKVEKKRVVRDSSGREESSITRSIGDKSYTVTTITDDSGSQEKHEKLQNMDEGDLSKFEKLWSKRQHEKQRSSPGDFMLSPGLPSSSSVDPHDQGLFQRLFGGGMK